MSGGAGGAAAAGGVAYQARVAAWAAARILAEEQASGLWGFPAISLAALSCETGGAVDDLLLVTSAAGQLFVQAKRRIDLQQGPGSEFASYVTQCVRQHRAGRIGVAGSGTGGGGQLDSGCDRLLLVTGPATSARVRVQLRAVLERAREWPLADPLESLATNRDERRALEVLEAHLRGAWEQEHGSPPSTAQVRRVLALMQVEVLDVEPGGDGEREAQTLLGPGVLADPSQRGTAWAVLVDFCTGLMRRRSGTDRRGLQQVLESAGVLVDPAQSYQSDIARLRARSTATSERLAHLAVLPAGTVEVQVDRPVTWQLRRAAAMGSYLVVGEPGAGKSAALHRLAVDLIGSGEDVVYLAVDDLAGPSLGALRQELGLEHELLEVLGAWTGAGPAYLLIDALDAARVQGTATVYRQLLREVTGRPGRWRVVCSIRKFDLRYSQELQQLFATEQPVVLPEEFQDPEFAKIRHLNVPSFSPAELAQLQQQAPALWQLLQAAPAPPLQLLLAVPFNLRLAAELLQLGSTVTELTPIRTQLELLDRYWRRRVLGDGQQGDANEAVLRRACEQMITARSLQVDRGELAEPAASAALDSMLSAQVLVEWQPTPAAQPDRRVLAFAHHLLFDYAVAVLLLAGLPGRATARVRADPELALVVRPSILLHFQRLWALDPTRERFWDETLAMVADDAIPEIAKLLGPLAAVELAESLSDLEPFHAPLAQASDAAADVLGHLVGALDLSLANSTWLSAARAACWCAVAERVSGSLGDRTAYPLRTMLLDLCKHRSRLDVDDLRRLGRAARRLLEFAWARTPRDPYLVTAGLQAVSRSFASDPTGSAALLRRTLQPEQLRQHGYQELPRLAQEFPELTHHDPVLVGAIYVAVLSYDEARTDPTPMSGSQILSLVSNIRQDFDHAKWQLGEFYPTYLDQAPTHAIGALVQVIDSLAASGRPAASEQPFDFRGRSAAVRDDRGHMWDWDWEEWARTDPVVKMLDGLHRYLQARAAQDDQASLQAAVRIVAVNNLSSTVWRRLLAVGTEHPTSLGVLLAPLAWAAPILAGPATAAAAGPFVQAVFTELDAADRERVEQAILTLPVQALQLQQDPDWMLHVRNRLLGSLDRAHLTTEEARALLAELAGEPAVHGAAPPTPPPLPDAQARSGERPWWARDMELNAEDERLVELARPVEAFLGVEPADQDGSVDIASLQSLHAALTAPAAAVAHPAVLTRVWELAARAATQLAGAHNLSCDSPAGHLARELLLAASRHPEPAAADRGDLEADTVLTVMPAPRTNAAEGLMALAGAPACADTRVLEAVERLATDPAPKVRYWVAARLNRLYQTARPRMWALAYRFAAEEPTSGVLHAFVNHALGRLRGAEPEQVILLVAAVYERMRGSNTHLDNACLSLLAATWADHGIPEADQALQQVVQEELSADRLSHLLPPLRSRLTHGPTEDADPAADQVRARSFRLFNQVVARARDTLVQLQAAWQASQPSEQARTQAREAAHILDVAMRELYHASGAFDPQASPTTPSRVPRPVHRRFYQEAHDLLNQMAEIDLRSVTHHLVEILEFFVSVDPRGVFLSIDRAIAHGGRQGGYQLESLAVDVVVRLVTRYLADYRELLHQDAECRRALQRILDTFVAAGWPEARRLTYQLDDIFR